MKQILSFTVILLFCCFVLPNRLMAQDTSHSFRYIRFSSSHTAFPEEKRMTGYTYESTFFDAASHYSDSSVLLVVPDKLPGQNGIDLVFWFHGWNNSIDSANLYFWLAEQFIAAHPNAVLVLAETSKNAPDSYGGRLEQPDVFSALVKDVINKLHSKKIIRKKTSYRNIILAGHSGAYRVIAFILQNGGVPVQEVDLFDALYSQTDKFINWIMKDVNHSFVHWFTNHGGGTDEVSMQMMDELKKKNISFTSIEESAIKKEQLLSGNILFIHSTREHNEIIHNPDNFTLLLQQSPNLLKKLQ